MDLAALVTVTINAIYLGKSVRWIKPVALVAIIEIVMTLDIFVALDNVFLK